MDQPDLKRILENNFDDALLIFSFIPWILKGPVHPDAQLCIRRRRLWN